MTVKDLIENLMEIPQNAIVVSCDATIEENSKEIPTIISIVAT